MQEKGSSVTNAIDHSLKRTFWQSTKNSFMKESQKFHVFPVKFAIRNFSLPLISRTIRTNTQVKHSFISLNSLTFKFNKNNLTAGERPYQCDQCNRKFTHASVLSRHFKTIHQENRPFACHLCLSTFKISKHLKQHLNKHKQADQNKTAWKKLQFWGESGNFIIKVRYLMSETEDIWSRSKYLVWDMFWIFAFFCTANCLPQKYTFQYLQRIHCSVKRAWNNKNFYF